MLRYKKYLIIFSLFTLTWAFYAQSLFFEYVWDDGIIFLDKNDLMVNSLSWRLISQPVLEGTTYFRPLVFLTWYAEFHLYGQNPFISHAINVLLHSLNVLMVYGIALNIYTKRSIPKNQGRAILAAVFYAIHPGVIQGVAWVSGRFDVMCTSFILMACLLFLNAHAGKINKLVGISIFFALALFSKELGIILPLIIFCIASASRQSEGAGLKNIWQSISRERELFVCLLLVGVLYLALRVYSMDAIYHSAFESGYLLNAITSLLPLQALEKYISLAIFPFGQISLFYLYDPLTSIWSTQGLRAICILLLIGWVFFKAVWRGRVWAWMFVASFISVALVIHIVPISIIDNIAQDRFMTLPLSFFGIAIMSLEINYSKYSVLGLREDVIKIGLRMLFAGWFIVMAFATVTTIPVWKNPLSLWAWAHHSTPEARVVSYNYMQAALASWRPDLVEKEIERIRKKNDGLDVPSQILLVNLLSRKGDPEAVKYMEGVMFALPQFHAIENGRERMSALGLTSEQVGGAYMDYANIKLIFDNDVESAIRYNQIAFWYFLPSQQVPAAYQKASIEYVKGNFDEAEKIEKSQQGIYFYNKEMYIQSMRAAVAIYCKKWEASSISIKNSCEYLKNYVFPDAFRGVTYEN